MKNYFMLMLLACIIITLPACKKPCCQKPCVENQECYEQEHSKKPSKEVGW